MLESLNMNMLVTEGGFKAKLSLINPTNNKFIYLKNQVMILTYLCRLIHEPKISSLYHRARRN